MSSSVPLTAWSAWFSYVHIDVPERASGFVMCTLRMCLTRLITSHLQWCALFLPPIMFLLVKQNTSAFVVRRTQGGCNHNGGQDGSTYAPLTQTLLLGSVLRTPYVLRSSRRRDLCQSQGQGRSVANVAIQRINAKPSLRAGHALSMLCGDISCYIALAVASVSLCFCRALV